MEKRPRTPTLNEKTLRRVHQLKPRDYAEILLFLATLKVGDHVETPIGTLTKHDENSVSFEVTLHAAEETYNGTLSDPTTPDAAQDLPDLGHFLS